MDQLGSTSRNTASMKEGAAVSTYWVAVSAIFCLFMPPSSGVVGWDGRAILLPINLWYLWCGGADNWARTATAVSATGG